MPITWVSATLTLVLEMKLTVTTACPSLKHRLSLTYELAVSEQRDGAMTTGAVAAHSGEFLGLVPVGQRLAGALTPRSGR